MARDFGLEQLLASRLQPRKCPRLVALHERRVADHIGGEDGGQAAFHDMSLTPGKIAYRSVKLHPILLGWRIYDVVKRARSTLLRRSAWCPGRPAKVGIRTCGLHFRF